MIHTALPYAKHTTSIGKIDVVNGKRPAAMSGVLVGVLYTVRLPCRMVQAGIGTEELGSCLSANVRRHSEPSVASVTPE